MKGVFFTANSLLNKGILVAWVLLWVVVSGFFAPAHSAPPTANTANAEQRQLMAAVEQFLFQAIMANEYTSAAPDIMIEVSPPSAHFGPCVQPQPFFPGQSPQLTGRVQVAVRCGSQGEQVRYLQAYITRIGEYVVAATNLTAGHIIQAQDIALASGDISNQRQPVYQHINDVVGLQVRRNIRAGQTVLEPMLQAPVLIERNDPVVVAVEGRGFSVQREGVAMDQGGLGEEIRVRVGSREILRATVVAPGKAIIQP